MSFHTVPPPSIPRSLWVLAWASLAGQVVLIAQRGLRPDDEVSVLLSVVLGALLVGWISAGVVRARTGRLVFVHVVLGLTVLFGMATLFFSRSADDVVSALVALAMSLTQLGALLRFRTTEWFAWQRGRPPVHEGPAISGLVLIAVVVGALGGLVGDGVEDGFHVRIDVAGR